MPVKPYSSLNARGRYEFKEDNMSIDFKAEIKKQAQEMEQLAAQLQALDKKRQELANTIVMKQGIILYLQERNEPTNSAKAS